MINCPNCGARDESEFNCGGESHIVRPVIDCDAEQWRDYLFFRDNPRGVTFERWRHSYGCGRWFNLARDTVTHEILAVYAIGDSKPRLERPCATGAARRTAT
jgi:sarcosine oxidase subunit delta